jgi:ABC-type sugar transport systems, permease components
LLALPDSGGASPIPLTARNGHAPHLALSAFAACNIVSVCVFLYPFVLVAQDSVTRGGDYSLENFRRMAGHWKFGQTFWNTILLAAVVVPIQLALALTMASIVSKLQAGAVYDPVYLCHSAGYFRSGGRADLAVDL